MENPEFLSGVVSIEIYNLFQFATFLNLQYWMPEAQVFIKPANLGLDILLVGAEINFKVYAQYAKQEEEDNDDPLPELVPL